MIGIAVLPCVGVAAGGSLSADAGACVAVSTVISTASRSSRKSPLTPNAAGAATVALIAVRAPRCAVSWWITGETCAIKMATTPRKDAMVSAGPVARPASSFGSAKRGSSIPGIARLATSGPRGRW